MNDVYIIEKMVVLGVWELMSNIYYTDHKEALDECIDLTNIMRKKDDKFVARVVKMEKYNKPKKDRL